MTKEITELKPESQEEQKRYNVRIGVNYPRPVVDFFKSVKANEKMYNAAIK